MSGKDPGKQTFLVQIQFQQNATWQGTITWTEQSLTQRFRSTLEMLKLMDDAVKLEDNPTPTWDEKDS
jgi:hypothetical protein